MTTVNQLRSQLKVKVAVTTQNDSENGAVNAMQNYTSKQTRSFVFYFCGGRPQSHCPSNIVTCDICNKVGHFPQVV